MSPDFQYQTCKGLVKSYNSRGLSDACRQGAQHFFNQAQFNSGVSLAAPEPKAAVAATAAPPASVGDVGSVNSVAPEQKGKGKGKGATPLGYQKAKKATRFSVPNNIHIFLDFPQTVFYNIYVKILTPIINHVPLL